MEVRARYLNGVLCPLGLTPLALDEGEVVAVTIERGRSMGSHAHQFAWIADAWLTLPETLADRPWAETPETLRKHALIATGYHSMTTLDCGATAAAHRVKAALVAAEARAHGYALGQVRGPVVIVWTPESQSVRAMGGDRFKASKEAILSWIAGQLGVPPETLTRPAHQGAAA